MEERRRVGYARLIGMGYEFGVGLIRMRGAYWVVWANESDSPCARCDERLCMVDFWNESTFDRNREGYDFNSQHLQSHSGSLVVMEPNTARRDTPTDG